MKFSQVMKLASGKFTADEFEEMAAAMGLEAVRASRDLVRALGVKVGMAW